MGYLQETLNLIHPAIQCTMKVSKNDRRFLDIIIHKDGKELWMDTYAKQNNSTRYVPFISATRKTALKKGFVKGFLKGFIQLQKSLTSFFD